MFNNIKQSGFAILNIDDCYYHEFLSHCNCNIITYGKNKEADIRIIHIILNLNNTIFTILYKNQKYKITTNLIGEFNVYNICAALSVALCIGIPIEKCIEVCRKIQIPAKVEKINYSQDFTLMFDTCHTTSAVQNLLDYLNLVKKKKIIVVASMSPRHLNDIEDFRKRAEIFTNLSNYTIFTFDTSCINKFSIDNYSNKLGENLDKQKYEICLNNKEAVKKSIMMASSGDIVIVTGYTYFYGLNIDKNTNPYLICKETIEKDLKFIK